jgi:hypothetical protein
MNPTEKMEMQVAEEQDGSAVAQLPDDILPPDNQSEGDDPEQMAEGGKVEAEDGLDDDPDREAIRAARREERKLKKSIHREKTKESSHLINTLKRQNQELADRLAHLEKRTSGAELARVDKAIDDTAVQVEYAKMKMREAVTTQDGDAVVRAQELMYESQRKLESLKSIKDQATKQMSQPPKQAINVPDQRVQKNAADWMERNPWYDPQAKDLDSEIAQRLDKKLTEEGYDPSSEDYWEELDSRVSKYLPHRMESGMKKKEKPKYKSLQTSSGRESTTSNGSGGNGFRISPERVAAMREAGVWDNPDARAKAIKNYVKWDRENKRG